MYLFSVLQTMDICQNIKNTTISLVSYILLYEILYFAMEFDLNM